MIGVWNDRLDKEETQKELVEMAKDIMAAREPKKDEEENEEDEEDLDAFLKKVKRSEDVAQRKEETKEGLRQSILSHMISDDINFELDWY